MYGASEVNHVTGICVQGSCCRDAWCNCVALCAVTRSTEVFLWFMRAHTRGHSQYYELKLRILSVGQQKK